MLKGEKILFCSHEGTELRPVRSSYRERIPFREGRSGGAMQTRRWVFTLGPASLLAWAPQTMWFKHRTGSCSIQLPSNSGILCIFDASAKQALSNIARKKKNYCSPVTASLTRWFLPNSLSRLCWLGSPNVFNLKPVKNISSHAGPWEPLEYNFMIRKLKTYWY